MGIRSATSQRRHAAAPETDKEIPVSVQKFEAKGVADYTAAARPARERVKDYGAFARLTGSMVPGRFDSNRNLEHGSTKSKFQSRVESPQVKNRRGIGST